MERVNYFKKISYIYKALLGYLAYWAIYPPSLSARLHKLRGVNIVNPSSVYIAPNVLIDSIYPIEVWIGDDVYITRDVKIIAHFNPTYPIAEILSENSVVKPVRIEDGVFVGVGAIILPGVKIGTCSIVGAGSVVTKDVPAFSKVVGNPAYIIGDVRDK